MDAVAVLGTASAAIGLAATVFKTAKGIRDVIHLAMSENDQIAELLEENKAEVDVLIETYNGYKELLDQHKLTDDLEHLLAKMIKLHNFLVEFKDDKPSGKFPSLKALWKAGDLKPKLEALNRGIVRIRMHWKERIDIRTLALLSKSTTETMDRLDHQDQMHTNATLTVVETIRAEATEVIKVIQHTAVQTRTRVLSMYSQIEPDGFRSLTTRVAVDTTSLVTFSILSPDASLSYDQIKMRIDEYSHLLKSDSPTIKFFTKNGKTIVCAKQADKMEKQLEQAKDLLQAMIDAKDVPTLEVIHRLRDLATVLDQLRLQEECLVVGDCAIKLARALGSRAVEFHKEQAQTITLIAGLDVYKSRARPLFIQAISVCEAIVVEDGSDAAKLTLIELLSQAGYRVDDHPALRAQWLGRAIDLIAELPSTMVTDELRGTVYINYGCSLGTLKEYSKALVAGEQAIAFYRSLASIHGQAMYKRDLAFALHNYGNILYNMGLLEDARSVDQEAVSLFRTLAVHGEVEHKEDLALALHHYGTTLSKMGHLEDALSARQESVSLYRTVAVHERGKHKEDLALGLMLLGGTLHKIGNSQEAVEVYEEAISLYRPLVSAHLAKYGSILANALINYGVALNRIGNLPKALETEQEVVHLSRTLAMNEPGKHEDLLADSLNNLGDSLYDLHKYPEAAAAFQEASSLYHVLSLQGSLEHQALEVKTIFHQGGAHMHLNQFQEAADLVYQAVNLYCCYGQNKALLWKVVHQYSRLIQFHRDNSVPGTNGQTARDSIAKHHAALTLEFSLEVQRESDAHQTHTRTLLDTSIFEDFQCDPDIVDCQCRAILSSALAIPVPNSTEADGSIPQHQPDRPSFMIEVPVTQESCTTLSSPSKAKSLSVAPLSPPSAVYPSPLPVISPSSPICSPDVMQLDPTNPHRSSTAPPAPAPTDQTPAFSAVIEDTSESGHGSEFILGPVGKRKREGSVSTWIKTKLRTTR